MTEKRRALVLMSGGLDSAVALKWALHEYDEVEGFHVDYGQRAAWLEEQRAQRLCIFSGVHMSTIRCSVPQTGSSLTDDTIKMDTLNTWLPYRNLFLITMAAMYGQPKKFDHIVVGGCSTDTAPDARPQFNEAASNALRNSLPDKAVNSIWVRAPFAMMPKNEIVRLGARWKADMHLTLTCYDPTAHNTRCGNCKSCVSRSRAFEDAGIVDPAITEERRTIVVKDAT